MHKPGSALRISYTSLFTGLLLVIVLIMLISPSTGLKGGGDDEGSGIGGTGRTSLPGGSGLGGTGLKPFVSMNADQEIQILVSPVQQQLSVAASIELDIETTKSIDFRPIESIIAVASPSQSTMDSSAINISEQIQRDLDINVLAFEQLGNTVAAVMDLEARESATNPIEYPLLEEHDSWTTQQTTERDDSAVEQAQLTWEMVSSYLSHNSDQLSGSDSVAVRNTASENGIDVAAKPERPERILRPQLPPVQRVRPIQRAAILPPRIKPLRL